MNLSWKNRDQWITIFAITGVTLAALYMIHQDVKKINNPTQSTQ